MTFTPSKDPKTMTERERRLMLADALDSGEYTKCTGQLRNRDDGFCCLGVACDLYGRFSGDPGAEWDGDRYLIVLAPPSDGDYPDTDESDADLPNRVREWFGFADENGSADDLPHGAHNLAVLNDGVTKGTHAEETFEPEPFPVIARAIREKF